MIRYVSVFLEASSGTHTFSRLPFNLEFCGVYCNFAKKDTDFKKNQNQSSYSSNCWAGKVAKSSLPLKVLGGVRLSENIEKQIKKNKKHNSLCIISSVFSDTFCS